jgi:hypothetical protein
MIRRPIPLAPAVTAGLILAAGAGALYAPFFVEAFGWKNPPGVTRSGTFGMLLLTMPLAIVAGGFGAALGLRSAADGRPDPAWRAARLAVGLWVALGLVFTLLIPYFILFIPLFAGAGGLSGLATAFLRGKGKHGPA